MADNFPDVYAPLKLRPLFDASMIFLFAYVAHHYDCHLLHSLWHLLCFIGAGRLVQALPMPMKKTLGSVIRAGSGGVGAAAGPYVYTYCLYTDPR